MYFIILFFFFNDTATTEIYTLSLHDALPIYPHGWSRNARSTRCLGIAISGSRAASPAAVAHGGRRSRRRDETDRKSTRLNSSHVRISYAVFCLKKKKQDGTRSRHMFN